MINNNNIKMLSMYYSAQNVYKNDLSEPLLNAVRPFIDVKEHSYGLLIEKIQPKLERKISYKNLYARIKENFDRIDSGDIKSTMFLGHRMSIDEIVENAGKHDTYSALYKGFFNELKGDRCNCFEDARENFIERMMGSNVGISDREKPMLRLAFTNLKRRPPISLEVNTLKILVDMMYDSVTESCGPSITDRALSSAINKADKISNEFSAQELI